MAERKIPMRMCVACRQMKPKAELLRVVKTSDGDIKAPAASKENGRGAYICRDIACVKKAQKSNALARALDATVDSSVYENIGKACEDCEG